MRKRLVTERKRQVTLLGHVEEEAGHREEEAGHTKAGYKESSISHYTFLNPVLFFLFTCLLLPAMTGTNTACDNFK